MPLAPSRSISSRPVAATAGAIEAMVRALPERLGLKPKAVFAALRLGMSGQSVTPGLFESLEALGREEAADRLTAAAALL